MKFETMTSIPRDGAASSTARSIEKVFAMGHGTGEDSSYSKNSEYQGLLFREYATSTLGDALERVSLSGPGPIVVADLGCSSGPNTIEHVSFIVDKLSRRVKSAAEASSQSPLPEFQAYFSDLPSTDFNNLFHLLSKDSRSGPDFFVAGVPGSFYGRLFCRSSVHVFSSANSLHWLSKIPDAVLDKESPAFNRGRVWISKSCPEAVKAFKDQALADLKNFLRARAEELVSGGLLFVFFGGRKSEVLDYELEPKFWSYMDEICTDLTAEGVLTTEQMDTLNIPLYRRTQEEVMEAIQSVDSLFEVVTANAHEAKLNFSVVWPDSGPNEIAKKVSAAVKGVLGCLIEAHVGKKASDIVWQRYDEKIRTEAVNFTQQLKLKSRWRHIVALLRK